MTDKPQVKDVGGRPTKYKAEYAEQAKKLCDLGATDVQLSDFFEVTEKTLNTWKHKHPKFLQSLKLGKESPNDNVKRSLYNRAIGYSHLESKLNVVNGELIETVVTKHYPPDPTSAIFFLKNRLPDEFREKPEGLGEEIIVPIKVEIHAVDASKPKHTSD